MTTTVYPARMIRTMGRTTPEAEAVAVADGRVVGVGSREDLERLPGARVDRRFADHVLVPGFVEAHSHVFGGGIWAHTYVGYFGRTDPAGRYWPGCTTVEAVLDRLRTVHEQLPAGEALLAWGLDPIYLTGERLVGRHLDSVSDTRPIFVMHASSHLATVNRALAQAEGITRASTTPGVVRDADGEPNGELQEPAAISLAGAVWRQFVTAFGTDEAKWNFARDGRNNGHTLLADLGASGFTDRQLDSWQRVTGDPNFPARILIAASPFGTAESLDELAARVVGLRDQSQSRLHFGVVKLILDGSIQGFTARLNWPFYFDPPEGADRNGLWLIPPDQMPELVSVFHRAGLTVHCHCNGDQAVDVFLDAVEAALAAHPRLDHRHTVQHCQLTTAAQYQRMAALGVCANLFSNHLFYWGDEHRRFTVGPERAAAMNACGTAEELGISYSFHSDSPVTPLGHLHVMWCAVNRETASGHQLGPEERISPAAALRAATLGAAHQLKLDHLVGSIEVGKYADFAVLDDDPLAVDPSALREIGVWGTVLGGEPQAAESSGG